MQWTADILNLWISIICSFFVYAMLMYCYILYKCEPYTTIFMPSFYFVHDNKEIQFYGYCLACYSWFTLVTHSMKEGIDDE